MAPGWTHIAACTAALIPCITQLCFSVGFPLAAEGWCPVSTAVLMAVLTLCFFFLFR